MFSSDEMLSYGFISKINSYNTNLKSNQMAEMTNEVKGFLSKAKELLLKDYQPRKVGRWNNGENQTTDKTVEEKTRPTELKFSKLKVRL